MLNQLSSGVKFFTQSVSSLNNVCGLVVQIKLSPSTAAHVGWKLFKLFPGLTTIQDTLSQIKL